jgi:hypothetical protein
MKITLPNYKPMSIIELYEAAATEMGYANTSEIKYDCTKINVAENIQDGFYEYYLALIRENDIYSHENEARADITMLLAMSGPKVDQTLKANEVEVFDGFTIQN